MLLRRLDARLEIRYQQQSNGKHTCVGHGLEPSLGTIAKSKRAAYNFIMAAISVD